MNQTPPRLPDQIGTGTPPPLRCDVCGRPEQRANRIGFYCFEPIRDEFGGPSPERCRGVLMPSPEVKP